MTAACSLSLLVVSCGLFYDVDALGGHGPTDAAVASDAGEDAAAPCVSKHGPPMIDADGVCIDVTEVTVADYEPFVAAASSVLPLEDGCSWVTTLAPDDFQTQKAEPNNPVVNVSYCHALHYCAWAGKHLCRRTSGAPVATGDAGFDPHTNEWVHACTHDGRQAYSYGPTVEDSACKNQIASVKTPAACAGPYPGLFDMLGNAGEWIDGCVDDGTIDQEDGCVAAGLERQRGEASCYDRSELPRDAVQPDLGFRCCGP
jgi:formylglycine-generating enzyme required for sulfatase activity